ncbi:hypothetical protein SynBMKMC1_01043 [Synechococcus sp. BMK-MC-1]|nr:hypothetical protein SynBMKMC1_01043 [Synechococcus sp. BMK-MC-1]
MSSWSLQDPGRPGAHPGAADSFCCEKGGGVEAGTTLAMAPLPDQPLPVDRT